MRIIFILILLTLYGSLLANPIQFSNAKMRVVYDRQKLSFYMNSSVTPFMKEITLDLKSEKNAAVKKITHAIFGVGSELVIQDEQGSSFGVSLYDSLPFVLIRKTIKNSTIEELKIAKVPFFEGQVSLGVDASALNTISTAGLKPATDAAGSYMILAVGNPKNNEGVVCGWLSANRGSGIVFSEAANNQVVLKARIDYGDLRIPAGKTAESETLVVGYGADVRTALEAYADAIAQNMKIKLLPQPTIYCTWYHSGASTEKKIAANTDFASENLKPYSLSVMQIDDFWQFGSKTNGPPRDFTKVNPQGPYPSGMKKTADYIKGKGMTAGIWFIPFGGSWYNEFWKDKLDLFLKEGASPYNYFPNLKIDNKPVFTKGETPYDVFWGGTCLDLSNPKAQEYVGFIANRFSKEWGYKYFKMDGLWTGTGTRLQYINDQYKDDDLGMQTRFNPAVTPIEGYAKGLETIRRSAGNDVFLLGCSQTQNMRTFGPSMGRVDAMRVGPDNGANAKALIRGPKFSSRLYFLNKRVWYNDPDPGYPRAQFPLEMAQTSLSWISLTGSLHGSSEQYAELPSSRLDLLRKTMPSHDLKTVRPVDYLENDPTRVWHLIDGHDAVRKDVIGLFNFDGENPSNVSYLLSRMDLPKAARYVGFDFWVNRFIPPFTETISGFLAPGSCRIISIRPEMDYPQVVSTSRHITQGVIDLTKEKWNASTLVLSGTSQMIANDMYEIRVVVPSGAKGFVAESVSTADPAVQTTFVQEGSCIRAKLTSPKTGKVNWSIRFKKGEVSNARAMKTTVTGTVDIDQVILKWDRTTAYQYRLKRNGEVLGEYSSESLIDRNVKLGTAYTYGVQTKDWNGNWGDVAEVVVNMPVTYQTPVQAPLPQVYCTELTPVGKPAIKNNQTYTGNPIVLDGKVQENGVGAMPGKDIVYTIPVGAKRFVSTVIMESSEPADIHSKCIYTLIGDVLEMGEPPVELTRSPALGAGEKWHFNVELGSRYRQIKLVSRPVGSESKVMSVNWINPGFLK
jgi:hypothetical protein